MTYEEINTAIAEYMGLTDIRYYGNGYDRICIGKQPNRPSGIHVPEYCEDLNAMHEAEKYLLNMDNGFVYWETYSNRLVAMLGTTNFFHATARQRAEAFLRTVGKWKEDL